MIKRIMKCYTILPINDNNDFLDGCQIEEVIVKTSEKDNYLRYDGGSIDKYLLDKPFWDLKFPNLYSTKAKAEKAFRNRVKDQKLAMEENLKKHQQEIKEIKKEIEICKNLLK